MRGYQLAVGDAGDPTDDPPSNLFSCSQSRSLALGRPSIQPLCGGGVTEVDVRAMLKRATRHEASVVEGRFMIHATHNHRPWIVIVEPDVDARLLVVVTPYEVSE